MTLLPDFSENAEKSIFLYFSADDKDEKAMYDELEKTYLCFDKMNTVTKDGKKYVVLQIAECDEE